MPFEYTSEEIDELVINYRLALEPSADRWYSIPATDLLDKDKSLDYLDKVASIFEATIHRRECLTFCQEIQLLNYCIQPICDEQV